MRQLLIALLLLAGCGPAEPDSTQPPGADAAAIAAQLEVPGNLQNDAIDEASGLAASRRRPDVLWTHNDSGAKARLYAMGLAGESLGRIKLENADNVDWEDIATFQLDDIAYLLVADVGDNDGKRETVTLYVVEEPDLDADAKPELKPAWRIDLRYPDGPRDVEAVAVDAANTRVLLLTKRTIPAELYAVPLRPPNDDVQTAVLLTTLTTLPQPSRRDIDFAPKTNDWFWQPTGMDIANDGSALAIITYFPAVYLYTADGSWEDAVQNPPLRFTLRRTPKPEAVAFSMDTRSLFVTTEEKHAALLRIDFKRELP